MEISPAVSSVNLSSINSIRSGDDPSPGDALVAAFTKDLDGNDIFFNDDWNAALNNPTPANIKKLHDDVNAIQKAWEALKNESPRNDNDEIVYQEFTSEIPGPFFDLMSQSPNMSDQDFINFAKAIPGNLKPVVLTDCVKQFLQDLQ